MNGRGLDYIITVLLHRIYASDNGMENNLQEIAGSSVLVVIENTDVCLLIEVAGVTSSDIKVSWADPAKEADVVVVMPVAAAINWLRKPTQLPSGVRVSGDAELLGKWRALRADYTPDIEQLLADKFGDSIARAVMQGVYTALGFAGSVKDKLYRDVADTLQHSRHGSVPPADVASFVRRVDNLRHRLEWLRVRMQAVSGGNK